MSSAQTPYQILGEEGIEKLCNAFYDNMDTLPEAADVRAMHAADLSTMKLKLAEYLTGWMGGPPVYSEKYGSVCMTTPHEPYHIGPQERDQWLLCMDKALEDIEASDELVEKRVLSNDPIPSATEIHISSVDLTCYDQLLQEVAPC